MPFPIGFLDIFQISQFKQHIIFPSPCSYNWVFLIKEKFIFSKEGRESEIVIKSGTEKELGRIKWEIESISKEMAMKEDRGQENTLAWEGISWIIANIKTEWVIPNPDKYFISLYFGEEELIIGEVHFNYRKVPPFTLEQLKAIDADPYACKSVKIELSCKKCGSKLMGYASLKKNPEFEQEGCIWQHDLPDSFTCECGSMTHTLTYMKESLHGLLGKDKVEVSSLSYERRYAHSEILKIVKRFNELLDNKEDEHVIQKFIEDHPVMLSRFHAKKIFIKPNILGKFQTDFTILDSRDQLILIELEKPGLKLFKKDGHPTAKLNHSYEQVRDWLFEYSKHPVAVLEGLNLKAEEVVAVKGAIIAGLTKSERRENIQRHLSKPSDIEFLTLDDLADSLIQISRDLA